MALVESAMTPLGTPCPDFDLPGVDGRAWRRAQAKGYRFPYLRDRTQALARALGAECTPDFFLYDRQRRLAYRGRLDDNWKDAAAVQRRELRAALDAVLSGAAPAEPQRPSMGCSIKWKPS